MNLEMQKFPFEKMKKKTSNSPFSEPKEKKLGKEKYTR